MRILGVNLAEHGSICMLNDGQIEHYVEAERITRKKYDFRVDRIIDDSFRPDAIALADCDFYIFSYLISEKNLKENDCEEIFLKILENEKLNGLSDEIFESGKRNFLKRIDTVNFSNYHLNDPFKQSGEALYYWSPIADELKSLD